MGSCIYALEELLTKFGIEVFCVYCTDLEAWQNAVCDTVSKPILVIIDVIAVCENARSVVAIVDNVFTTPVFSNAFQKSVDVVVYSTKKCING